MEEGEGWSKSQKKIINKKIHSYGFLLKKYSSGGSVQVRLLQINYEVNDKSRLEIKRDFLNLNTTHE